MMLDNFPFKSKLSFKPLIQYWENESKNPGSPMGSLGKELMVKLEAYPHFKNIIETPDMIDEHREFIETMMSVLFSPYKNSRDASLAMVPFQFKHIYANPVAEGILGAREIFPTDLRNINLDEIIHNKTLTAYFIILKEIYNYEVNFDFPIIIHKEDEETGLTRCFRLQHNEKFCEVIAENPPALSENDIEELLSNLDDLEAWKEKLPPEAFEFHGFVIITLIDVTEQEVISSLKYDLLENSYNLSTKKFHELEVKLRNYFKIPSLQLGLGGFNPSRDTVANYKEQLWKSLALQQDTEMACCHFSGSIYEKVISERKPMILKSLKSCTDQNLVEERLISNGIKSLLVAPLQYEGELIGVLELGAQVENQFNSFTLHKLKELLPLFAVAMRRSAEEIRNKIQVIIKEQFTNIHPTVEWRFTDEAIKAYKNKGSQQDADFGNIVFHNVYPMYGLSDIRNSSLERNRAIQDDLIHNLNLANDVLQQAHKANHWPILDEYMHRINKKIRKIKPGLVSGDEYNIHEFLHKELNPLFSHINESSHELGKAVEYYQGHIDPSVGMVYNRRKEFEDSLTSINTMISNYMDEVEREAQKIFPHYFEKYKTDGVEYNMYIGQSLVKSRKFHPIYLENFRLWQLMITAEIARQSEKIKSDLPLPLDNTHLILLNSAPISIRFRQDEKKFDVDGAYNIRYEIVKKRIDKAFIKGTNERLTQPGQIAIVYSQSKEAEDYNKYIDYLVSKKYLEKEVEYHELEELQGVKGLKALRVAVKSGQDKEEVNDISKLLKADIRRKIA
ncbi:GAF domain-containing protein [Roseivirga sp. BDSF3-8]|uniref:GAF domain-containing protein n=1 Tax=Roseivirga sp. BDSF3-8 TaxID=3241598 RepID=UPI0035320E38